MIVLPEMVGSVIGVHQGKGWIQVEVKVQTATAVMLSFCFRPCRCVCVQSCLFVFISALLVLVCCFEIKIVGHMGRLVSFAR
jgi:hypothetical protein